MSLLEIANEQRHRWYIYLFWFVLIGITVLVLYSSVISVLTKVNESSLSNLDLLGYLFINLFIISITLFFFQKSYKDLMLQYSEKGIVVNYLFSQKLIRWENINRIEIQELSGQPVKFEIESDDGKIAIVALFYKNPSVITEILKSEVKSTVIWRHP